MMYKKHALNRMSTEQPTGKKYMYKTYFTYCYFLAYVQDEYLVLAAQTTTQPS